MKDITQDKITKQNERIQRLIKELNCTLDLYNESTKEKSFPSAEQ